jgi:hypothetical protein
MIHLPPPFIKKSFLGAIFYLFATYLGSMNMLFILIYRHNLLHICYFDQ